MTKGTRQKELVSMVCVYVVGIFQLCIWYTRSKLYGVYRALHGNRILHISRQCRNERMSSVLFAASVSRCMWSPVCTITFRSLLVFFSCRFFFHYFQVFLLVLSRSCGFGNRRSFLCHLFGIVFHGYLYIFHNFQAVVWCAIALVLFWTRV